MAWEAGTGPSDEPRRQGGRDTPATGTVDRVGSPPQLGRYPVGGTHGSLSFRLAERIVLMGHSVKQWAKRASSYVAGCTTCVGYFGKEDGYVSLVGRPCDPDDLLMSLDVPKRHRPEVLVYVTCGECGNSVADEAEIWVWNEAQVAFRSRVARAIKQHERPLREFRDFLAKYPFLGAMHRTGRALMGAVRSAEGSIVVDGRWWRCIKARNKKLVKEDFRAPLENQEHPILEGRYNHAGQPHWYLADSIDTGTSEILDDEAGIIYAQQFELAPCENVLDLWTPNIDEDPVTLLDGSLLKLALVLSRANVYERVNRRLAWKPGYLLPRFIMDAARHAGFTGIRYNSVRAMDGVNLVLFNSDTSASYSYVGEIERHTYKGVPLDNLPF